MFNHDATHWFLIHLSNSGHGLVAIFSSFSIVLLMLLMCLLTVFMSFFLGTVTTMDTRPSYTES